MTSVNGDNFFDILEERRKSSDIAWVSRKWDCTSCRYSLKRSPQDIKQKVLSSVRIQSVIKELSQQNEQSEEDVQEMANVIIDEMGHNYQLKAIRFFGFLLSKLMKRLYGSILVNRNGLEKVANISSQYPILFLPTHRSYADFLLVSYICFHFNLPVPVIAAGLDFLGLKTVSTLLRNSGAFFIRRSFIGDRLYWEIFSEYVQTHIEGSEFPLEFFIEGTRSRTAKSLVPKIGMLQVIMEVFFSSKIPDVTIVPISISYDRTLEESLYAYELLGIPKPKESTKGLIKARKILSDHFGNVYVRFGEPISSKQFFRNYDRSVHNLHPRSMSVMTKEEQVLCRDLANHVVRMHQCNLVMSLFPLMCLVIGHPHTLDAGGVHLDQLADLVFWLEELLKRTGASVFTGNSSPVEAIEHQLKLHSNIIQVSENSFISAKCCEVKEPSSSVPSLRLQQATLKHAVPEMFVYHYGNQALQLLVHMCMICMAGDRGSQDDVFFRYNILRKLLQREFIFERLKEEKDFTHALQSLKEERIFTVSDSKIIPMEGAEKKIDFLRSLLIHFLQSYHIVCQHLVGNVVQDVGKSLVWQCQGAIESAIINGHLSNYKCLSLDVVNNCITLLVTQGFLRKEEKNNQMVMTSNHSGLMNTLLDIEMFLPSARKGQDLVSSLSIQTAKL